MEGLFFMAFSEGLFNFKQCLLFHVGIKREEGFAFD